MITDIRLQQFRSYADATFEFSPSVNIIVGPNASGKTNLLEAVLVVARGSSYRVRDSELVGYGQPWARLDAHTDGDARTVKIILEPTPSKTYDIGDKTYRRLSTQKMLPVVVFEPNHLYMLSGSPELRRTYLDDLLEQTTPDYGKLRRDYRRVLSQRNALLKQHGHASSDQIFPWNVRLSEIGGAIVQARQELINTINSQASELYGDLAHKPSQVSLRYESKLDGGHYATALLRALEHNFGLDVARGFTGAGPHRDDLTILINSHPAQVSASRGETRTAVLMLKVMELRLIMAAHASGAIRSSHESSDGLVIRPILLLDDVFSELDGSRRQALTSYLQEYQTFITTTDADLVVHHFMDTCRIVPLGE